MKLSIIIVNYNVSHFIEQALLSLRMASVPEMEIIVVDNNSADKSVDMIRYRFPEVILIENKNNKGFSKANNQGIKIAKGEYVLLLNPDTVVQEDTLKKCCAFMDLHPEAGGLGVMMVDGKGQFLPESKRSFPTPWVAFYKVFGLAAVFPHSSRFGRYHLGFLDKNKTHEIEVLSGAYMFLRKTALEKVGYLDEDYFMYGEDIDLSFRITQGGFKNYYFPETRIIHYKGESTKKTSLNYVFTFYKAMIIFANKRFSRQGAFIFSILINIAIYLRAILSLCLQSIKVSMVPAFHFLLLYAGMYVLKNYWETNFKFSNYYPPEFMNIAVPLYIIIWILAVYTAGGFDQTFKLSRIIRGVLIGTVVISALTNFVDNYRFSKALLLMGTAWAICSLSISRFIHHFIKFGNFKPGQEKKKKVAIIGNPDESMRAIDLMKGSGHPLDILGFITPAGQQASGHELHLGSVPQMENIIQLYHIDEIIFCSKDFSANQIIEWMMNIDSEFLEFKILPHQSNYIIGSNSKNTRGDYYTLTLELNLIQKGVLRKKRMLDLVLSLFFVLLSPLFLWFIKKPSIFFSNIFRVMHGKYTWVGLSPGLTISLPRIKNGILTPVSHISTDTLDQNTIDNMNLLYAKNYTTVLDLNLIYKSFRYLGG
jgi:GT2 family glycosyltransferase